MPDALRSLWHYTYSVYKFHSELTNAAGNHHPWESKPWTWPMSLRPVLYAIDQDNIAGCGAQPTETVRSIIKRNTGATEAEA